MRWGVDMGQAPGRLDIDSTTDLARGMQRKALDAKRRGAREGRHPGGVVPYGYRMQYDEAAGRTLLRAHPLEENVVRRIFTEYLRNRSLAKVARRLEADGIRTRIGRPWSRAAVAFLLGNETYLGTVKYGDIRSRGNHPALVSPIIFHKVQKVKRQNVRRGGSGRELVATAADVEGAGAGNPIRAG